MQPFRERFRSATCLPIIFEQSVTLLAPEQNPLLPYRTPAAECEAADHRRDAIWCDRPDSD